MKFVLPRDGVHTLTENGRPIVDHVRALVENGYEAKHIAEYASSILDRHVAGQRADLAFSLMVVAPYPVPRVIYGRVFDILRTESLRYDIIKALGFMRLDQEPAHTAEEIRRDIGKIELCPVDDAELHARVVVRLLAMREAMCATTEEQICTIGAAASPASSLAEEAP